MLVISPACDALGAQGGISGLAVRPLVKLTCTHRCAALAYMHVRSLAADTREGDAAAGFDQRSLRNNRDYRGITQAMNSYQGPSVRPRRLC